MDSDYLEIELAPVQILLGVETYEIINSFLGLHATREEIRAAKEGVHVSGVERVHFLTRIRVSDSGRVIRDRIAREAPRFLNADWLESHADEVYDPILRWTARERPRVPGTSAFLLPYLRHNALTMLVDTLADSASKMLQKCIYHGFRAEYSPAEARLLSVHLFNQLAGFLGPAPGILEEWLTDGRYWTSPRHLALVSAQSRPLQEALSPQKEPSRENPLPYLADLVPDQLSGTFNDNIEYLRAIIPYKRVDAQVQVRAAFLLRGVLERELEKEGIEVDLAWEYQRLRPFIRHLMEASMNAC